MSLACIGLATAEDLGSTAGLKPDACNGDHSSETIGLAEIPSHHCRTITTPYDNALSVIATLPISFSSASMRCDQANRRNISQRRS
jgi:hypothetical protein